LTFDLDRDDAMEYDVNDDAIEHVHKRKWMAFECEFFPAPRARERVLLALQSH
jgi:hypothetical protein